MNIWKCSVYLTVLFAAFIFGHYPACAQEEQIVNLFAPTLGKLKTRTSYDIKSYDSRDVEGQSTDFASTRHRFRVMTPLYQTDRDELTFAASLEYKDIDTDARLPDTNERFPEDLWGINVGATFRHLLEDDKIIGGYFAFGSRSDKPFDSAHETTLGTTLFVRIPDGDKNAWLWSVNYSNNREFLNNIPLPGVAYQYAPSKRISAIVGVPFALVWYKPTDATSLFLGYYLVRTVHAKARYRLSEVFSCFAGFDWDNQRYLRSGRRDREHRLFYYEKRLNAGVAVDIMQDVKIEIAGGYAFDRFYFEGTTYSDRSQNRIDVNDGPYASINAQFSF
jgi:hypothetical protein